MCRSFLDRTAIVQEFQSTLLTSFNKPSFGWFSHVLKKMPFQHAHGNARLFCQSADRPISVLGKLQPVLNAIRVSAHKYSNGFQQGDSFCAVRARDFLPQRMGGKFDVFTA
jgi:hypothetical protein